MSKVQPHTPLPRRPRGRAGRVGSLAAVPELLSRRETSQEPAPRRRRMPLLPFALGMALGFGLAHLSPQRVAGLLASVLPSPTALAGVLNPLLGIGNRPILVLGSDQVGGNTDVMFTLQVKNGITRILQVPRDTFVETEKLGVVKANALYGSAGVDAAKEEISRLVGMPVRRHLKVNLDAVVHVADALGGIEIDVPKRMYYVDNSQGLYIDLYPGRQVLRGDELLGFLRFRHDEAGDLGRMERQRLVINQVFTRLAQPSTLTQLPALLKIAGEDISTDLTPIEMTQLLTAMARTKLSTTRLPGRLYWQDDLSYWMPDSNTAHPTGSGQEPMP